MRSPKNMNIIFSQTYVTGHLANILNTNLIGHLANSLCEGMLEGEERGQGTVDSDSRCLKPVDRKVAESEMAEDKRLPEDSAKKSRNCSSCEPGLILRVTSEYKSFNIY